MFIKADPDEGEPRNGGLPWDPFKAIVAPRPIGWITTVSQAGVVNLAPYSYFNAIADKPNMVYFASSKRKDSQRNAEETGEFVCSLATWDARDVMNATSTELEPEVGEPEALGLEMAPSTLVRPPRVAAAPAALECVYLDTYVPTMRSGGRHTYEVVFGEVVGIYLDERLIRAGRFDTAAVQPLARLGYDEYGIIERSFSLEPTFDMWKIIR